MLNDDGVSCQTLNVVPVSATGCVDVSQFTALDSLAAPSDNRDKSVEIISYLGNDPSCPLAGSTPVGAAFALPSGILGVASAAGQSFPISVISGVASVSGAVLTSFKANVGDMVVNGSSLTDLTVSSVFPAPLTAILDPDNPHFSIAAQGLNLLAEGRLNGTPMFSVATNDSPISVTANSTTFGISGNLNINSQDINHRFLPVTIAMNVVGAPASAQTIACAQEGPTQKLFGFETQGSWTSAQVPTTLVTSPITQGCGAIAVTGQGYFTLNSAPFSTRNLTLAPAISVDLFIPNNQPNQSYLGAMQMYLTCPSGNVFNEYIGQVELTGKPTNQYSTLHYPLPSNVTGTLQRGLDGCFFSIALNVNQTGQAWDLDNLRFTP